MQTDQIGRARPVADSLLGGPGVREFAVCEFPREDLAWVAAQTRRPHTPKVRGRSIGRRFRRIFGSPEESESDTEPITDPAAA